MEFLNQAHAKTEFFEQDETVLQPDHAVASLTQFPGTALPNHPDLVAIFISTCI
jgi:hypothetical protein